MKEKWEGGYVHRQKNGRPLFIIERQVHGRRFHASTRCHNLTEAREQLRRFEAAPALWNPLGGELDPLRITNELVTEYCDYSEKELRNSKKHVRDHGRLLADWMIELGSTDLKSWQLADFKRHLRNFHGRHRHRVIAIKAFSTWLRTEKGLLKKHQDITQDVPVPKPQARLIRAVDAKRIHKAFAQLEGSYADMFTVLINTGMHISELERFIRHAPGTDLRLPGKRGSEAVVPHKNGMIVAIALKYPDAALAAKRLRERKRVPRKFREELHRACDAARIEHFTPGDIRSTVTTFARDSGATIEEVAAALHHMSPSTTRRYYDRSVKAPAAVPTIKLQRRRKASRKA